MTTQFDPKILDKQSRLIQPQMLDAITNVRMDWELVAKGESLLYHEGSIGLILFDIVTKLEVSIEEQRFLLGPSLFDEIEKFVTKQG